MTITAEEWEVLGFFEVEPKLLDPAIAWPYNEFLYEVNRGDTQLSCALAPAYQDVRITIRVKGGIVFESNVIGLQDVRFRTEGKSEYLDFELSSKETMTLRVSPRIEVRHTANFEPGSA